MVRVRGERAEKAELQCLSDVRRFARHNRQRREKQDAEAACLLPVYHAVGVIVDLPNRQSDLGWLHRVPEEIQLRQQLQVAVAGGAKPQVHSGPRATAGTEAVDLRHI